MNFKHKYKKMGVNLLVLGTIMGIIYYLIEILWRGWSKPEMIVVGGVCSLAVGFIDESERLKKLSFLKQNTLATVLVLLIELVAGIYLNIYLQKNIWDYSDLPFNIMGQISLMYAVFWFLLCPFGFWLDNWIRHFLAFGNNSPIGLIATYKRLINKN